MDTWLKRLMQYGAGLGGKPCPFPCSHCGSKNVVYEQKSIPDEFSSSVQSPLAGRYLVRCKDCGKTSLIVS